MDPLLVLYHFGAMFVLGLSSGLHCVGMCGPLSMMALGGKRSVSHLLSYHAGRITSYLALASVVAAVGVGTRYFQWVQQQQFWLTLGLVLAFFLLSLVPSIKTQQELWAFRLLKPTLDQLRSTYLSIKTTRPLLANSVLGLSHGLVPCGMVYSALILATATGSAVGTVGGMLYFGFATSLVLSLNQLLFSKLPIQFTKPWYRAGLLALSLLLVFRVYVGHENHQSHLPNDSKVCVGR